MEYETGYLLQGVGYEEKDLNLHEVVATETEYLSSKIYDYMIENMETYDSWINVAKTKENVELLRQLAQKIEADLL
jgi:hypothetical protein